MAKPKVYVIRRMAQEALDKIAQVAEMEVWPEDEELPPPHSLPQFITPFSGELDASK